MEKIASKEVLDIDIDSYVMLKNSYSVKTSKEKTI